MIVIYPVIFSPIPEGLLAYVPDLEINTHGSDLANAIVMARDAISIWCVSEQDDSHPLPMPSALSAVQCKDGDIATLVDADIDVYRRTIENRAIKKTLTLPSWLNVQAEKAGLNFSQILQKALKDELQIVD